VNPNENGSKRTDKEKEIIREKNLAKREEERATHEKFMTH
jgi:hypothetical protein